MDYSITENGIRVLTASEGCVLTQAHLDEAEERIFTNCLYLGVGDSEDNWIECTDEEKEQHLQFINNYEQDKQ